MLTAAAADPLAATRSLVATLLDVPRGTPPLLTPRVRRLASVSVTSLALLPLQGELVNTFRFTAVLFPLHLWAGERLAAAPMPVWLVSLASWISLNVWVTRELAYGKWAY